MKLEVISIDRFEDHKFFEQYMRKTSQEDVFFDFYYLIINDKHEDGATFIALLTDSSNEILASFAFVKRKYKYNGEVYYDIITPYEYGGILLFSEKESVFHEFFTLFESYCIKNKVLTLFQRIDPFLKTSLFSYKDQLVMTKANDNVYVDLSQNKDVIFTNFHKNNRRDIRYALRNGVTVKMFEPSEKSINTFYELYKKTMDDKEAKRFYYFNEEYFNALKGLKSDNLSVFVSYSAENNPISAALILKKGDYSHYHLSGTDRDYTKLCGNNLLLYEAILKMKSEGRMFFHLGGAAKSQSGLYKFKKKFSNNTIPYYISKKVLNKYIYTNIVEGLVLKGKLSEEDISNSSFFPLYRK